MSSSTTTSPPRHFPVKLSHTNRDETIREAKKIVLELRPKWRQEIDGLKTEFFTEGITNTILSIWNEALDTNDRILIRVYGEKTELFIDRDAEKRNMVFLNRHECASPLYGTFENGIVYGYIPGRVLELEDARDPHLADLIAKQMAKMHAIDSSSDQQGAEEIPRDPMLLPKIRSFIDNLPKEFEDSEKQKRFSKDFPSKDQLLSELESIKQRVEYLKSPVVFCHNDLLIKNLVHDKDQDAVLFIDYEYAEYNFQAYDIGDHFCEYAGVETTDFSLYPDEAYQKQWLKTYLKYYRQFINGQSADGRDVQELYVQVNCMAAMCHFFWAIWSIIQARHSTIDFDFMQYGIDRMQEYHKLKSRTWDWTIPK